LKSGELRIASLPGPALEFVPRVLADFLQDKPDVKVDLKIRPSVDIEEWVATRHVDIGIAELPIDSAGVDYELFTLRCVCVVPQDHMLAGKRLLTPKDLDNVPFIGLEPGHIIYSRLASIFQDAGVRFNVRANVQLFSPACVLVERGIGVSIVDPITAELHKARRLKAIPFSPAIPFSLAFMVSAGRVPSLLAGQLVVELKKGLASYVEQPIPASR